MNKPPVFFNQGRVDFQKYSDESVVPSAHWVDVVRSVKGNFGWISYEESAHVGRWGSRPRVRKYVARFASHTRSGRYTGLLEIGSYKTLAAAVKATQARLELFANI